VTCQRGGGGTIGQDGLTMTVVRFWWKGEQWICGQLQTLLPIDDPR
jgi:hypothetical protein